MKMNSKTQFRLVKKLQKKSKWVRKESLDMALRAKKGHLGGALSVTDILVSIYYSGFFKVSAKYKKLQKRDRVIFSKGHACLALYAILADLGFIKNSDLLKHGNNGSILGGHPDHNIPGIEISSGSLGHGLSIGAGLTLGAKIAKINYCSIVILGDGECMEGSIWEAASFSAKHKLGRLIAIVDNNKIGATDYVKNFVGGSELGNKFKSFGWKVIELDGHNFKELLNAYGRITKDKGDKPIVLIANTIKGKGVSFMENNHQWHHGIPEGKLLDKAVSELNNKNR